MRLYILCLSFILSFGNVSSQRNHEISFGFGMTMMNVNTNKYIWSRLMHDFPSSIQTKDFSDYSPVSVSFESFALLPTALFVDWGYTAEKLSERLLPRTENHWQLFAEYSPLSNHQVQILNKTGTLFNGNRIFYRDMYDVFLECVSVNLRYAIYHYSNYKGKNKNYRLWIGIGGMGGFSTIMGYGNHTEGVYEVSDDSTIPSSSNFNLNNAYWQNDEDIDLQNNNRFLTGFLFPFGIECKVGKKERCHVGLFYNIGGAYFISSDKYTISSFIFDGGLSIRLDLNK